MATQELKAGNASESKIYQSLGVDEEGISGSPRLLSVLASTLERLIQKNEKLVKGASSSSSSKKDGVIVTIFHGSRPPPLSIRQYIDRIFKYSNCSSPSCFVVAYIYLDRFLRQMNSCLTSLNAHRLLITSFLLATKVIDDEGYNNAYYAKVGGVSTAEMNRLEVKFLECIGFRLHVTAEEFDNYCLQLVEEEEAGGSGGKCRRIERPSLMCGLTKMWSNHHQSSVGDYTCRAI